MRSGLLRVLYWSLAAAAVAFVAGIWFFLPGTSAKHITDLVTGGRSMQPTDQTVAPSPTLVMLRKMLPELARPAHPDDRAALTTFYEERRGPLIWVTESGLSDKGRAVIREVRNADDWGLRSSDFTVPQLTAGGISPEVAAEAEIKLTLTVLKYARYARGGRISDPSRISNAVGPHATHSSTHARSHRPCRHGCARCLPARAAPEARAIRETAPAALEAARLGWEQRGGRAAGG